VTGFRVTRHRGRWSWTLATDYGSTIVARGVRSYPDEHSCRRSLDSVRVGADFALAVQCRDGRWRWELAGDDGSPLAVSGELFDSAEACGNGMRQFRRVAGALAGIPRQRSRTLAVTGRGHR